MLVPLNVADLEPQQVEAAQSSLVLQDAGAATVEVERQETAV